MASSSTDSVRAPRPCFQEERQQIQDAGILLAQHQHVNVNSVEQCSFLKIISDINFKYHFTSVRNTKARLDISQCLNEKMLFHLAQAEELLHHLELELLKEVTMTEDLASRKKILKDELKELSDNIVFEKSEQRIQKMERTNFLNQRRNASKGFCSVNKTKTSQAETEHAKRSWNRSFLGTWRMFLFWFFLMLFLLYLGNFALEILKPVLIQCNPYAFSSGCSTVCKVMKPFYLVTLHRAIPI